MPVLHTDTASAGVTYDTCWCCGGLMAKLVYGRLYPFEARTGGLHVLAECCAGLSFLPEPLPKLGSAVGAGSLQRECGLGSWAHGGTAGTSRNVCMIVGLRCDDCIC